MKRDPVPYLCAIGILFAIACYRWLFRDFIVDDTYITLRYADNILAGNGPVWNAGERVEGYTSPLFLGLLSLLRWLGLAGLDAARTLSLAGYAATIGMGWNFLRQLGPRAWALPFTLAMAGMPPLLLWGLSGMETTLFAACLLGVACHAMQKGRRHAWALGLWLAASVWMRPEGTLVALLTLALLASRWPWRHLALSAGLYFAALASQLVWRIAYYGEWLPNTYYAKLHGSITWPHLAHGLRYLWSYSTTPPFWPFYVALAVAALLKSRPMRWHGLYLGALLGVFAAYIAYAGGDWMVGYRFLVPLMPLGVLALALAIPIGTPRRVLYVGALILTLAPATSYRDLSTPRFTNYLHAIAGYINQNWAPNSLIAINMAGLIPYETPQMRYLDMLGLNNRHIAHRAMPLGTGQYVGHYKGDGAYVLERAPDYIIQGDGLSANATMQTSPYTSEKELAANPAFAKRYTRKTVTIPLHDPQLKADEMTFTFYEKNK